jgi:hypothetical protein
MMSDSPAIDVLLRVPNGRIHRATKIGNAYRVGENCNLDDSRAEYEIDSDQLANAEDGDLCRNPTCFPDVPA